MTQKLEKIAVFVQALSKIPYCGSRVKGIKDGCILGVYKLYQDGSLD